MVVEPGLAYGDEFGMAGQRHEVGHRNHRLLRGGHGMGAGGVVHALIAFGDGAHARLLAQTGTDRDHASDAGGAGAGDQIW